MGVENEEGGRIIRSSGVGDWGAGRAADQEAEICIPHVSPKALLILKARLRQDCAEALPLNTGPDNRISEEQR